MSSLTVELFLIRIVQTLYSFEHRRKYNVQLNWVVGGLNFRYHRLFARIRRVTGKERSNVVANNRCTVHLLKGLQLSAHRGRIFDILVYLCRRYPRMKKPIRPLGKVIWWFLVFSIKLGSFDSDWVHNTLTNDSPVALALRFG